MLFFGWEIPGVLFLDRVVGDQQVLLRCWCRASFSSCSMNAMNDAVKTLLLWIPMYVNLQKTCYQRAQLLQLCWRTRGGIALCEFCERWDVWRPPNVFFPSSRWNGIEDSPTLIMVQVEQLKNIMSHVQFVTPSCCHRCSAFWYWSSQLLDRDYIPNTRHICQKAEPIPAIATCSTGLYYQPII